MLRSRESAIGNPFFVANCKEHRIRDLAEPISFDLVAGMAYSWCQIQPTITPAVQIYSVPRITIGLGKAYFRHVRAWLGPAGHGSLSASAAHLGGIASERLIGACVSVQSWRPHTAQRRWRECARVR